MGFIHHLDLNRSPSNGQLQKLSITVISHNCPTWLHRHVNVFWLADVSSSAIGPYRSLQLRERRVELRHPAVGDLQPGDVSLPWDDQPTGKRAGGER